MVLSNIITGFIVVLVGVTLVPTVADAVQGAKFGNDTLNPTNVTGTPALIVSLTTLFFSIGVMAAGVAIAVNGLRQSGMM